MPDEHITALANDLRPRWRAGQAVRPWLRKYGPWMIALVRDEWTWSSLGEALTRAGITYRPGRPWDGEYLRTQVARAMTPLKGRRRAASVTTPPGNPSPWLGEAVAGQFSDINLILPENPMTNVVYPPTYDRITAPLKGRKRTASVTTPPGKGKRLSPWLDESMVGQFPNINLILPQNQMPYSGYPMTYDQVPAVPAGRVFDENTTSDTADITSTRTGQLPNNHIPGVRTKSVLDMNPLEQTKYFISKEMSKEMKHSENDHDPVDHARPSPFANAAEETARIISKLLEEK